MEYVGAVEVFVFDCDEGVQSMSTSHPHQLLRQMSQPTESASTSAMTSAWLSQSSPGSCPPPTATTATAANPPMSSSSSSSSSSWPGHSSAVAAEMPVLIRQSPVHVKQDTSPDAFQPPSSAGSIVQKYATSAGRLWKPAGFSHNPTWCCRSTVKARSVFLQSDLMYKLTS